MDQNQGSANLGANSAAKFDIIHAVGEKYSPIYSMLDTELFSPKGGSIKRPTDFGFPMETVNPIMSLSTDVERFGFLCDEYSIAESYKSFADRIGKNTTEHFVKTPQYHTEVLINNLPESIKLNDIEALCSNFNPKKIILNSAPGTNKRYARVQTKTIEDADLLEKFINEKAGDNKLTTIRLKSVKNVP